ncbi:hypothetical protein M011DRAFT_412477 [Sporormia fimetaria CBS 119925]|uniref:Uncharacterized protein n=1 Tax=Sporormia fimetaria CBS 119925 TaxID=1340428 RepID=A0A6A6UZR6_9PLEO|nr:hypothetical protein M011DRAFT_412477 [Sporormia fimetaria CBS 119925]
MNHTTLLKWTLTPTILLAVICIVNLGLTTLYWIVGDWIVPRGVEVHDSIKPAEGLEALLTVKVTIIEYLPPATDSTLVSAALGLFTAVVCGLAWYKLRRVDMDEESNMPRRRFWLAFPLISLLSTSGAALGSLILHYTQKDSAPYGCRSEMQSNGDRIMYCTREMGACNVLPDFKRLFRKYGQQLRKEEWVGSLCMQTQAVKWMQLGLVLACVGTAALLCAQGLVRGRTRYERVRNMEKGKGRVEEDGLGA